MILVTTAGTLLVEATHAADYVVLRATNPATLETVIDQLELVGTVDDPPVMTYDAEGIEEDHDQLLPYALRVHRADAALFVQSEILNYIRYRKFTSHRDGLDSLGQLIVESILGD